MFDTQQVRTWSMCRFTELTEAAEQNKRHRLQLQLESKHRTTGSVLRQLKDTKNQQ